VLKSAKRTNKTKNQANKKKKNKQATAPKATTKRSVSTQGSKSSQTRGQ
jgi:hypothetical protein